MSDEDAWLKVIKDTTEDHYAYLLSNFAYACGHDKEYVDKMIDEFKERLKEYN